MTDELLDCFMAQSIKDSRNIKLVYVSRLHNEIADNLAKVGAQRDKLVASWV